MHQSTCRFHAQLETATATAATQNYYQKKVGMKRKVRHKNKDPGVLGANYGQLADGPTRRRIKSSRDVGELVLNPIQLIRS